MSLTTAMIGLSSNSPNPLAIIIPVVFVSFLLLSLAACCCAFRRKGAKQALDYDMCPSSSMADQIVGSGVAPSLTLCPVTQVSVARYQHLRTSSPGDEIPPPYSPRSVSPLLSPGLSLDGVSPSTCVTPSIRVDRDYIGEQDTITAPSSLISRTGSPSLQLWSPSSVPDTLV